MSVRVSDITVRKEHLRILALNDINNELDEKEIDSWIRLTRVLTHEIMNALTVEWMRELGYEVGQPREPQRPAPQAE